MQLSLISIIYVVPIILFISSFITIKYPPKKFSRYNGFRTPRSMKSLDAWIEGNKYSSRLLFKLSTFLLVFTTLGIIWASNVNSYKLLEIVISSSTNLTILFIVITVIKTEKHLKKVFEA